MTAIGPHPLPHPPQDEREWELNALPVLQVNEEVPLNEGSERLAELSGKVSVIEAGLVQERSDRQGRIAQMIQALPTGDNLHKEVHVAVAAPEIDFSLPEEAMRCPTLEGHCDPKHCTVETRIHYGEAPLTNMALSDCVPKMPSKEEFKRCSSTDNCDPKHCIPSKTVYYKGWKKVETKHDCYPKGYDGVRPVIHCQLDKTADRWDCSPPLLTEIKEIARESFRALTEEPVEVLRRLPFTELGRTW